MSTLRRFGLPAVALGIAALLLVPQPNHDTSTAQVAARLLANDAAAEDGPLFSMLRVAVGEDGSFRLDAPELLRRPFETAFRAHDAARPGVLVVEPGGTAPELVLVLSETGDAIELRASIGAATTALSSRLPSRGSLLAPLVAIGVALVFRRTVLALYGGVLVGAIFLRLEGGAGWATSLVTGAWDVPFRYFAGELTNSFRIELISFTFALIAMVGVMSRGGGVAGFVTWLVRFASGVRSTLAVSFGMGLSIFFDDYSNCLIVGNTMRPLTDRLRISREKLAYVVDSTAAPVAGLSLLSTWVVFEVSTYSAQLPGVGITDNPYAVFLQTIPFRFYCLFSLLFVVLVILTGRDFGPMRRAEERAWRTGEVVRRDGQPLLSSDMTEIEVSDRVAPNARNAILPILFVIVLTIEEIFRAGGGFTLLRTDPSQLQTFEGLTGVLFRGGGAGPLVVSASAGLLLASALVGSNALRAALATGLLAALALGPESRALFAGTLAAVAAGAGFALGRVLPTRRSYLPWNEILSASLASVRALLFAIAILFGAWMIGAVCTDARTAEYLVALTQGAVSPVFLPVLLFGAACLVSFATGTSWGTMGILLPNVVAVAASVGEQHAIGSVGMVVVCIGAVLEGSIFGDHCSPISDTTVLSSVATASDHLDHVRTQAPYALVVAGLAVVAGYLPTLLFDGWSFPLALAVALCASLAVLYGWGRASRPRARAQESVSLSP